MVFRITLYSFLNLIIFLLGFIIFLFRYPFIDFSSLENIDTGKPSIVYDNNGKELFKFALEKKEYISLDKIPKYLIDAFIAAEDHDFFSHSGISIRGIIRSFLINLYHKRVVQGASTITQQLIKILFLSYERNFLRKIKEAFLAFQIENFLTKEQILELYINNIYFGRGIYGVEAASKRFWNKGTSEVSLDEAALLASVAKSAKFFSPLNSISGAKSRRNIVLNSMNKLGFISDEEYINSRSCEVEIKLGSDLNPMRLYVQEWIRQWLERQFGRELLYKKGLKIWTTLNLDFQAKAEIIFRRRLYILSKLYGHDINGGMLSIDVTTGAIRSFIGGIDFYNSQYNRAFQAYRQMGSSFKPILYSAALFSGIDMDSTFVDEPLQLYLSQNQVWMPRNWDEQHHGTMTLAKALTISNNIIAIKVFLKIGSSVVLDFAKKFGIHRNLQDYNSLPLGVAEATIEENAAAFNVFANHGYYVKPYLIESVYNEFGEKIYENLFKKHQVLSLDVASKMVNALSIRMQKTKEYKKRNWIDSESIGKTGSTNRSTTTWFVGSTPEITTSVYIGFDDNRSIGKNIYATHTSYPLWLEFHRLISTRKKVFYLDPKLKEALIDWNSGRQVDKQYENTVFILK